MKSKNCKLYQHRPQTDFEHLVWVSAARATGKVEDHRGGRLLETTVRQRPLFAARANANVRNHGRSRRTMRDHGVLDWPQQGQTAIRETTEAGDYGRLDRERWRRQGQPAKWQTIGDHGRLQGDHRLCQRRPAAAKATRVRWETTGAGDHRR